MAAGDVQRGRCVCVEGGVWAGGARFKSSPALLTNMSISSPRCFTSSNTWEVGRVGSAMAATAADAADAAADSAIDSAADSGAVAAAIDAAADAATFLTLSHLLRG